MELKIRRHLLFAIIAVCSASTQVLAENTDDQSSFVKSNVSIDKKNSFSETPQVLKDNIFDFLDSENLASVKQVGRDVRISAQRAQDARRVKLSSMNLPEFHESLLGVKSYDLAKHENPNDNYYPTLEDARLKAKAHVLSVTKALGTTLVDFELAPTEDRFLKSVSSGYQVNAPLIEREAHVKKVNCHELEIPFRVSERRYFSIDEQDNAASLGFLLHSVSLPLLASLVSPTMTNITTTCNLLLSSPAAGTCSSVLQPIFGAAAISSAVLSASILGYILKSRGMRAIIPKSSKVINIQETSDRLVPHYLIKDIEMEAKNRQHAKYLRSIHKSADSI